MQHLLRNAASREALEALLPRLREITVGHPQFSIGVILEGRWIVPLSDEVLSRAAHRVMVHNTADFHAEGRSWVIHRIRHAGTAGPLGRRK